MQQYYGHFSAYLELCMSVVGQGKEAFFKFELKVTSFEKRKLWALKRPLLLS